MGALATTGNPATFANQLQTYFNPKLLEALKLELVLSEYGLRGKYPAHGSAIRFFRPRPALAANVGGAAANAVPVGPITEGTTPTNLTEVAVGYVDVSLSQRGALAKLTDIVQALDLLNTVKIYTETMGAEAALDLDTVVRKGLLTGMQNSDTAFGSGHPFERYPYITITDDSSNDYDTFKATANVSKANGKITRAVHLGCVTQLKRSLVPMINGRYVAVTPPEVIHDIRQDANWVSAAVYDIGKLYKRGVIELDGCVFVEANNGLTEGATYGTATGTPGAGNDLVYTTWYLGKDAFGVPELSNDKAGSSPFGPKMIILAQPDKADPLNLVVTLGWKCYYGAKALIATTDGTTPATGEVPRYVQLRTKSTF